MKLYATVTSERASKGQGGNKYLRTSYTAEMENGAQLEIMLVYIEPTPKGYQINISSRNGDELYSEEYIDDTKGKLPTPDCNNNCKIVDGVCVKEGKGKQQKGECCVVLTASNGESGYCPNKATKGDFCNIHADGIPL